MAIYVGKKFKIIEQIGNGAFGKIYKAENQFTNEMVAVKLEKKSDNVTIKNEAKIYTYLKNLNCIPKIKSFGIDGKYNFMAIDLLDKSLDDLVRERGKLSLKETLNVGEQLIQIMEQVHEMEIIHRDIKPENFMFSGEKIKIIDFGLSKKYIQNKKHIPLEKNKPIIGTPYFIGTHIHEGFTPSRRDDMESIGYIIMYLLFGVLPWHNQRSKDKKERNQKVYNIKNENPFVLFKDAPKELNIFIRYCRRISFAEKPNYLYLINLLHMTAKLVSSSPEDNISTENNISKPLKGSSQ